MIVAWRREGIGGSITVASFLAFYLIHLLTAGKFPKGWGWLTFAAPGFLFLLCWYWSRKIGTPAGTACARPGGMLGHEGEEA